MTKSGMTKVRELMTREVPVVSPLTPCIEVARQMSTCGTGIVVVYDKERFRGIITERDIVNILANVGEPLMKPAGSIIGNCHSITITPDDDVMQAANVMVENGVRVLPVVENGKLCGLLSLDNLARTSSGIAALVFVKTAKYQAFKQTRTEQICQSLTGLTKEKVTADEC